MRSSRSGRHKSRIAEAVVCQCGRGADKEGINASTYYRWERELLTAANQAPCSGVPAVTFAELPEPKQVSRNVAERCATLHIGSASLDIYSGCNAEQLKMLVELLRPC